MRYAIQDAEFRVSYAIDWIVADDTVVRPDVVIHRGAVPDGVWHKSILPHASGAENRETSWFGGPDLAIETVGGSDMAREKFEFNAKAGTRELLILDRDSWQFEWYYLRDTALELKTKSAPGDTRSGLCSFGNTFLTSSSAAILSLTPTTATPGLALLVQPIPSTISFAERIETAMFDGDLNPLCNGRGLRARLWMQPTGTESALC